MYAVIGANGFLGSYCIKAILENTNEYILATARDLSRVNEFERVIWRECDIQSDESVNSVIDELKVKKHLKIIYLAAYHHPDKVQENQQLAWNINVTCLSKFLNKAYFAEKIYYASTDSVYGESEDGYHFKESDPLNPVNFYGHNKCAAEALMVHLGRNVVRFPFLISPSIIYKPHFYDVIAESIKKGEPFEMFEDSYRSSLSFENAGKILIKLMEMDNVPQIINVCGDKDYSKYEVGLLVADREKVSRKMIIPVSIAKPQDNFSTKRATSTLMDNTLLKKTLGLSYIDIFDDPK